MKKIVYIVIFLFATVVFSQNSGITYQAVIYIPGGQNAPGNNVTNVPMANKNICLQFSFIDGTNRVEYQEAIKIKTDEFGMVNITIGQGNQTGGYAANFDAIVWSALAQKTLQVGLDVTGSCSQFEELSKEPIASVPFANAAITAENVTGVVGLTNGGTGATTAAGARINLGLGNLDNTADLNKPMSTATKTYIDSQIGSSTIPDATASVKGKIQLAGDLGGTADSPTVPELALKANSADVATALAAKENTITAGTTAQYFRGDKTWQTLDKSAVGLANVDNTSDATKPISTVTQAALNLKANATDLAAEVTRATAAEATLTTNVAANATAIATETTRATAAENTLTTNLTAEVTRATAAEATLTTNVAANATAIATETTRATAAETTLTIDLAAEVTRATAAEATLTTNVAANATAIVAETTRATAAENTLTTDLAAEVTRATAAEALKAPIESPTFTGTVSGIDKAMVGLANVDNTSDVNKPISTVTQAALDLKENLGNKSTDIIADATSTDKYPSVKVIKDYVDTLNAAAGVADGSITSAKIADGTIVTADLAADAIETATIKDASVTTEKLASSAVTEAKLADDAVTSAKIKDGEIVDVDVSATAAIAFSKLNIAKSDIVGLGIPGSDTTYSAGTGVTLTETTFSIGQDVATTATPTFASVNKVTLTAPATGSTLTIADGKTVTVSNSITLAGTDATTMTFPSTDATIARTDAAQTFTGTQTFSSDISVNGIIVGRGAGEGDSNIAIGTNLGTGTGYRNTGIGVGALQSFSGTSFGNNTGIGYANMQGLTTGYGNTSLGGETLASIADNDYNTAIGNQTLRNAASSHNSALGASSGNGVTSGSGNTFLGSNADINDGTNSNATAIGYGAVVSASNAIQLGNSNVTLVNTSGAVVSASTITGTQVISTVATGTPPLVVTSTTPVANLNIGGNAATVTTNADLTGDVTSDGNVTTIGTSKVVTAMIADANVTDAKLDKANIPLSGFGAAAANVDLGLNKLTNVTDPSSAQDAATKKYVDDSISSATIADADATTKGKLQLAGDLSGTAALPVVASGAITTAKLATDAVETAKIKNAAVTTDKIADANVTEVKLADNAITSAKIKNGEIATVDIADAAITYAKIQNVAAGKVLGNFTGSAGVVEEIATSGTGDVVRTISPTFTGTPTLPTGTIGVTQTAGDSSTALATTAFVTTANATNANLTGPITSVGNATSIASQTGTGTKFVMDTSPTLVTPTLGVATATSINKVTLTAPATGSTLTIADGKTVTVSNSITLAGTDATTMTFPSTDATIARTDAAQTFTGTQTFSSTIAGSITGNAGTATKLATARKINTVDFDGSGDITVTAAAGTLTGDTLASTVLSSSLTSVGTLTDLTVTNAISGAITGNAGTATKLATARKINTVDFDGSGDITVTAAAGTLTGDTLASTVLSSSLTSVGTIATGTWNGSTIEINHGGTGATTATAAFDALSPMTTKGDIIYGGDSGTGTRLAKGNDGQVLTLASGVPTWASGVSSITTKTSSYTLTLSDNYVIAGSGSGVTFTLPTAVGNTGKEFTLKNISSNNVTIATTSSQKIIVDAANSAATTAILGVEASNNWIRVISDGTHWIAFRALF